MQCISILSYQKMVFKEDKHEPEFYMNYGKITET